MNLLKIIILICVFTFVCNCVNNFLNKKQENFYQIGHLVSMDHQDKQKILKLYNVYDRTDKKYKYAYSLNKCDNSHLPIQYITNTCINNKDIIDIPKEGGKFKIYSNRYFYPYRRGSFCGNEYDGSVKGVPFYNVFERGRQQMFKNTC
jgi:hypothetical protein